MLSQLPRSGSPAAEFGPAAASRAVASPPSAAASRQGLPAVVLPGVQQTLGFAGSGPVQRPQQQQPPLPAPQRQQQAPAAPNAAGFPAAAGGDGSAAFNRQLGAEIAGEAIEQQEQRLEGSEGQLSEQHSADEQAEQEADRHQLAATAAAAEGPTAEASGDAAAAWPIPFRPAVEAALIKRHMTADQRNRVQRFAASILRTLLQVGFETHVLATHMQPVSSAACRLWVAIQMHGMLSRPAVLLFGLLCRCRLAPC